MTVERLNAVEERVLRGRAALGPLCEAVATRAFVVGLHIDRARRAALDDLSLNACSPQRTVGQCSGDGRPGLFVGEMHCGGHSAAEKVREPSLLVSLPALTMCETSAAIMSRLAFSPFAISPVVLRGCSLT